MHMKGVVVGILLFDDKHLHALLAISLSSSLLNTQSNGTLSAIGYLLINLKALHMQEHTNLEQNYLARC